MDVLINMLGSDKITQLTGPEFNESEEDITTYINEEYGVISVNDGLNLK